MSLSARSILFTGLFAGLPLLAVADSFTFTTIDDPLGPMGTSANGINNSGQIVGGYTDANGITHGFLFSGGSFTSIDDPTGSYTVASGINNSGQIVGSSTLNPSSGLSGPVAFLDSGGTFTQIVQFYYFCGFMPPLNCSNGTFGYGVNDAGQIVGYYNNYAGGGEAAFEYSGGLFTITDQEGYYNNAFNGINNAGEIVGYSVLVTGPFSFVDNGGIFTPISDPLGTATYAEGINNSGQIVGYYLDSGGNQHGFLDNGGIFTTIDDPSGTGTVAKGINDAGKIVGYYTDSSGSRNGFLATSAAYPEPSTLMMVITATLGISGFRARKWLLRL